jgi:hypothetical protein
MTLGQKYKLTILIFGGDMYHSIYCAHTGHSHKFLAHAQQGRGVTPPASIYNTSRRNLQIFAS